MTGTILITGGCGFVGTNLIAYISSLGGPRVRVFDNESLGKREHLSEFDVEFIHGDLRDVAALGEAVAGVDAVVHLAADTRVVDSISNPQRNFETNVVGTFNLLQCMRNAGVSKLVNASTGGAILGEAPPPIHEDMVARPLAPYGASKLATEGYCSAFAGAYGLHATTLRFSNVYGPRSFHKGSVIAHFFKRILAGEELVVYGDGSQIRDFVFVGDLAAGIWRALESGKSGVFQLGSGSPTRLDRLIDLMRLTVGDAYSVPVRYAEFRPGEVRETWCDISRARDQLGYEAVTDLTTGLERTWEWFRSGVEAVGNSPQSGTGGTG